MLKSPKIAMTVGCEYFDIFVIHSVVVKVMENPTIVSYRESDELLTTINWYFRYDFKAFNR